MVISITRAETMPKAVNTPKVRMVAVPNVTSEAKESAATEPAASITGPTRTMHSTIASSSFPRRWYSS